MPCTAKKGEANKLNRNGFRDVDAVLTITELEKLLRKRKVDLKNLEPSEFDSVLGESSGASVIFGASGGVMEATLRTLNYYVTGENELIEFREVRGSQAVKFFNTRVGDRDFSVAVVSGLIYFKNYNILSRE